ncbi:MAG: arginine--tRNA ligase [Actinobacteria bacterium]|nr:MAG: arginine--tRNA ligase [Actinomycetota bacterium]
MARGIVYKLAEMVGVAESRAFPGTERRLEESPEFERPARKEHGDFSTNFALLHAKDHDLSPRQFADALVAALPSDPYVLRVEVAGPGFINFYLNQSLLLRDVLTRIDEEGDAYGSTDVGAGARVQVEFVSANPVGPMHVGHGRWAALGDSLANVMEAAGYEVEREFYINDYGNQMNVFGASVEARYAELLGAAFEFPEDGYGGAYIYDIAREIVEADGDSHLALGREERVKLFTERAYAQVLEHMKATLAGMEVVFDVWFSERALHRSGAIDGAIEKLRGGGHVYEADGAVWFRSTAFGDDKDRVLIRENGQPTYLAADVAYHQDKLERGFDRIINIWGADHHGYVKRMEAAVEALSGEKGRLEVIIGQLVNVLRRGEPVRMSKRTGEMITFEELLDEVGPDAARYWFLTRSTDSPVDFDLELAKEQSNKNPVFYVQYGHARISSILRKAVAEGVVGDGCDEEAHAIDRDLLARITASEDQLARIGEEAEIDLISHLSRLPDEVEEAAVRRAPYKLTAYAYETARRFHNFYERCRVISDDRDLTAARLFLVKCSRQVLANVLGLLGVSAPDRM